MKVGNCRYKCTSQAKQLSNTGGIFMQRANINMYNSNAVFKSKTN